MCADHLSDAARLIGLRPLASLGLGFALLILQGLGEIIKRIAWLQHKIDMDIHYERPLQ